MSHSIILPRLMEIGDGALKKLPDTLSALDCRNPIIITDKTMVALGQSQKVAGLLKQAGIEAKVFDNTIPEPTNASINAGYVTITQGRYDSLIALGGGSVIDSAKAMALLACSGGVMRDYCFPRVVSEPALPLIAIPTTAGTGSEVTRFTIITDEKNDEKMLCVGPSFMPSAALVDPQLTHTLPTRMTADTGIDALTHAIESYVSRKGNAFSDFHAREAMRLIAPNLRRVCEDGRDVQARADMMLGATLAGIAFSNASVALVHGMSRPIGAFFHVPHGLSNAMLLPSVTTFSLPAAPERYADCARAMGVATKEDSTDAACQKLLDELDALNRDLNVPTPEGYGIDRGTFFEHLDTMASQALASGSPANNPRIPSHEEMVAIYTQLWR
ncbi:alcohol dehydrogenase [Grimontia hollisae]|uniref:Iron-containing alcohol dehydrogenase n=2 Tax=Grimontia hollisae TaxID=673 RepID=D0I638_GRIHO|nr:iron-containing alcohol dehydrogenase [Grimontia hollisae]AMG29063.1 alcohol dehydrogenase [Grimontia hollisae]EEY73352.1 iron-containing alcohol dehydrogenase [Grimontia hollisae CIP 101886]MDF2186648.1 iron-containing alcohol dehydrogenase [Grimontia hollisae]STO76970.1 Lactaldehyde reductase [Grimontia hollisae]STO98230.1 Lactaldehyde reductase [Grimontia hollisae]